VAQPKARDSIRVYVSLDQRLRAHQATIEKALGSLGIETDGYSPGGYAEPMDDASRRGADRADALISIVDGTAWTGYDERGLSWLEMIAFSRQSKPIFAVWFTSDTSPNSKVVESHRSWVEALNRLPVRPVDLTTSSVEALMASLVARLRQHFSLAAPTSSSESGPKAAETGAPFDPLRLAWRLVADGKAPFDSLLHLDKVVVDDALKRFETDRKETPSGSRAARLARAERLLAEKQPGRAPSPLWLAWARRTLAPNVDALLEWAKSESGAQSTANARPSHEKA